MSNMLKKTTHKPHVTRAERRIKQRQTNISRAQKMHEARISVTDGRFFTKKTKGDKNSEVLKYYVGCSGWYYWDWKSKFYPADLPTNKWFEHYMNNFDTVELNAPFYSWPTVATVRTWKKQAEQNRFIYTVKACELITHIKRFQRTKTLVKDFGFIADLLGPLMGCFLFQLPPSFTYTPARLKIILNQLDETRRNVVEFRHVSWWNKKVFEAFRQKNVIFCSCSGPKLPDQLVKTADDVYIRFHGTQKWYRHDYSKKELEIWADRICTSGAKKAWIYFNNDYNGYAIKNARELITYLQKKTYIKKN